MGEIAGGTYSLGVELGLASFQFSVKQNNLANQAIADGQVWANFLADRHVLHKGDSIQQRIKSFANLAPADAIVRVRQNYEAEIRHFSNTAGNTYVLGLVVAIAEGQATSVDWSTGLSSGGKAIAKDCIFHARDILVQNLIPITGQIFDLGLLDKALKQTGSPTNREIAYKALLQFRIATGDVITRSSL